MQINKGLEEIHPIPKNIHKTLISDTLLLEKWNKLTEIARNEWICWITISKTEETRCQHLERFVEEVKAGGKRPCCWPGCPHRNPNNAKWFSKKK